MARTSNKAQLIVDFVNQFVRENGFAPSVREIGAAVGLRSTASVSYHIQALQAKGLLLSPGEKGRKRALSTQSRPGQIPVVGVVTAGMPILAFENLEGTMAWDGDPACFALHVKGDSMIGAGILDGDIIIADKNSPCRSGDIVVGMGASTNSAIPKEYGLSGVAPIADYTLLNTLCSEAAAQNKKVTVGNLFSSDFITFPTLSTIFIDWSTFFFLFSVG